MNTSLRAQSNKPMFGTTEFAVSPVDSSEHIDISAEETCPAESVPMSEPRADGDAVESPPLASLEVMDQLKALAQNVTQGNRASLDESSVSSVKSDKSEEADASGPGESQLPEPSISVFPRPAGLENNQVIIERPKFANRALILAGFAVAALIGAGGTFAWQAHQPSEVVTAAAPAAIAPAPLIAPYLGRQLEELADDISSVRRGMEELAAKQQQLVAAQKQLDQLAAKQQQLATKQEQVGQSIAKLQTLEQARQKTPAPVQSRLAPVPPRPSVPPPPAAEATLPPPPPPPRTAEHPIPPLPVPQR